MARLVERQDLVWIGLEHSLDCLPALAGSLGGGAIVDVESLTRLPRGYDVVLSADLLEHLTEPQRMLRQIRDSLPPGGLLLISVPNVAHVYIRLALLFGSFTYAERGILDRTHRIFFTRSSLRELLRQEGFRIEREAVSIVPLPLALPRAPERLVRLLTRLLEPVTRLFPTLLGYQLLAAARKSG